MALVGSLAFVGAVVVVYVAAARLLVDASFGAVAGVVAGVLGTVPPLIGAIAGGLPAGVAVVVVAGALVIARTPRTPLPALPSRGSWLAAAILVTVALPVVLETRLWDSYAHVPLVAAGARGLVPLELPTFPGPFAYHTGFDVVAASWAALTDVDAEVAIDVVAVALLVVLALQLDDAIGPASPLLLLLPSLGHGPLAVCTGALPLADLACDAAFPGWQVEERCPPPLLAVLFQHPQCFGFVVGLGVLLLLRDPASRAAGFVGVGVALLFRSHVVVYVAVFGAVVCVLPLLAKKQRIGAIAGLVVAAVAFLGGGFQPDDAAALAPGGFFAGRTAAGVALFLVPSLTGVLWTAAVVLREGLMQTLPPATGEPSTGDPLPTPSFRSAHGPRRPDPLDLTLLLASVSTTVVGLLLHYERSWDIVKFVSVGEFFGLLLLARRLRSHRPVVVVTIVALCAAASLVWSVRFGLGNGSAFTRWDEPPAHPLAKAFGDTLAPLVPARDCVLTPALVINESGVLAPGTNPDTIGATLALDRERMRRIHQQWLTAMEDLTPAAFDAFGCGWLFVAGDDVAIADDGTAMNGHLAAVGRLDYNGQPWFLLRRASPSP